MPAQRDEPRSGAGTAVVRGAETGDADLAGRVEEMERQLQRTQVRQRALIRALTNISTLTANEMERLLVD